MTLKALFCDFDRVYFWRSRLPNFLEIKIVHFLKIRRLFEYHGAFFFILITFSVIAFDFLRSGTFYFDRDFYFYHFRSSSLFKENPSLFKNTTFSGTLTKRKFSGTFTKRKLSWYFYKKNFWFSGYGVAFWGIVLALK